MFKSGFVTVIGRPNVGKSTLLNNLIGQKISIVSSKPQTTRNNIQAIMSDSEYQIVFIDTPGIHKPRHKLGEYMVRDAEKSVKDVDLILFLTTPGMKMVSGDTSILENLNGLDCPVFLVLNKIDENTQENVANTLKNYSEMFNFAEIIPISALKGKNVGLLKELMVKYMPEGPKYYPDDIVTDAQEKFIVSEIIREKSLRLLNQEVPHGIAVDIVLMKKDQKNVYNIEANVLCEKESHKGIIIGKQGTMLKKITEYSKQDIEKMLGDKVKLKLWVKVRKEWRDNVNTLKELGYK